MSNVSCTSLAPYNLSTNMPKKHFTTYQSTKPQSIPHPSLSTSQNQRSQTTAPATVNALIEHLRISQRPSTGSSTQQSALSKVSPTVPFRNASTLSVRGGGPPRRRIAGPPPPRSWLEQPPQGLTHSRHAPPGSALSSTNALPPPPLLPSQPVPAPGSLQAQALRAMAANLTWHLEAEGPWLAAWIPPRHKSMLLAILMASPGESGVGIRQLGVLFGPVEGEGGGKWRSGGEGVTHAILGPVVGDALGWADLGAVLSRQSFTMRTTMNNRRSSLTTYDDTVPDSWEDSSSSSPSPPPAPEGLPPAPLPSPPLFPNLTYLSLACCPQPSWRSLLSPSLLENLAHLTHLDLAYWPQPSLTPNAALARVVGPAGDVEYSATGMYSASDGDWSEATSILRRLGRSCRGLVWLGLEGCRWIQALGYVPPPPERPRARNSHWLDRNERLERDRETARPSRDFDWNGIWRGLNAVSVGQGWVPPSFQGTWEDYIVHNPSADERHRWARWIKFEREVRALERKVGRWRLDAGLAPPRFEKTAVQDWVDLELREVDVYLERYL